jgi:hypothetical protein
MGATWQPFFPTGVSHRSNSNSPTGNQRNMLAGRFGELGRTSAPRTTASIGWTNTDGRGLGSPLPLRLRKSPNAVALTPTSGSPVDFDVLQQQQMNPGSFGSHATQLSFGSSEKSTMSRTVDEVR